MPHEFPTRACRRLLAVRRSCEGAPCKGCCAVSTPEARLAPDRGTASALCGGGGVAGQSGPATSRSNPDRPRIDGTRRSVVGRGRGTSGGRARGECGTWVGPWIPRSGLRRCAARHRHERHRNRVSRSTSRAKESACVESAVMHLPIGAVRGRLYKGLSGLEHRGGRWPREGLGSPWKPEQRGRSMIRLS
jgi:hypothetical protein